jgi:hypothetical protein
MAPLAHAPRTAVRWQQILVHRSPGGQPRGPPHLPARWVAPVAPLLRSPAQRCCARPPRAGAAPPGARCRVGTAPTRGAPPAPRRPLADRPAQPRCAHHHPTTARCGPARPPAASREGAGGEPQQPERAAAADVARQLKQLAASGAPPDRQRLQALTLQLHEQLPHLSTHQLSRAASTLARLGWRPGATLAALCSSALARLDAFGTPDLVWLVWALGRLQYSTSLSKKLAKEALGLLLERHARQQQQAQQQALSELDAASLLWACARLGYRNDLLLEPLLELLLARHSPYQQQQQQQQGQAPGARTAANVVWACARLGLQHRQLQDWAQAAELEQAAPQAVANIVWGLWKLGEGGRAPAAAAGCCGAALPSALGRPRAAGPRLCSRAGAAACPPAPRAERAAALPPAAGRRPSPALVATALSHLQACAGRCAAAAAAAAAVAARHACHPPAERQRRPAGPWSRPRPALCVAQPRLALLPAPSWPQVPARGAQQPGVHPGQAGRSAGSWHARGRGPGAGGAAAAAAAHMPV